ncbi:MAG: alpha/beta hydrolase [Gammaproteobacteria bacterium]|nr:alpha/beta hydrolase [Gammaproteobacteria bacterium]
MHEDYFFGVSEEGFHRIFFTEWEPAGNGLGTVIAVHGLTRNGRDFDFLAQYLAAHHYHVYCPDIVGRGESDWLKDPQHYTYEQYVADMNAMIARTGVHDLAWIGTSMGGIIGMVLASMNNTPIRCLVLNDIGAQIPATGLARLASYPSQDPEFKSLSEAVQYFKKIYSTFGMLSEEEWLHLTEHSVTEVSPRKWVTKLDHRVKLASAKSKIAWSSIMHPFKALEGIMFDVDLWSIWRKIKCPVLIIHGKDSDMLTTGIINKMHAIHPHTEVLEVEQVGHAPPLFDQHQHEVIAHWLAEHY